MGLMGDAADNIPGVKGIGEKTAMKLIAQFGTIEDLLRRVEEVTPPRIKALLIEQAENARLSFGWRPSNWIALWRSMPRLIM